MKCEKCNSEVKYIILKDKLLLCEKCTKEYLKQFGNNIDEFEYIIPYGKDLEEIINTKENTN